MKHNIKKLILLVLTMTLCLALFVGCGDTPDPTPDGSDEQGGGAEESPYLDLTKDGEVLFTLVYDSSDALIKTEAEKLVEKFAEKGLTVKTAELSDKSKITECEILVGKTFPGRSEYEYDTKSLGAEGYTYFAKGNKIVVTGGSSEFIAKALGIFTSDVLRVDSASSDINNINVERTLSMVKPQSYRITSVTINGTPVSEYQIVPLDSNARSAASTFKNGLYQYTGNDLPIEENAGSHNIFFELVDNAGKTGYRVKVDENGDLHVECAFKKSFVKGTESFVSSLLVRGRGDIVIDKKYEYTTEVSKIYYADYGVVGDGVADDYAAIKMAHDAANLDGYTVVAGEGRYNLGQHTAPIIIMTDVDFTGATFIIDDSKVEANSAVSKSNVFAVRSKQNEEIIYTIASLKAGQTNIGVTFDGPMLVYIRDGVKKMYIRYGENENSGLNQQESILVDKDGNVDPSTPILWDYDNIDRVVAYPVDDPELKFKGGTFITIANQAPSLYTYYDRGISIGRSNVIVDGLTFLIQGELDHGAPYSGFLAVSHANKVTIQDSVVTGHKKYILATDSRNSMGSYALTATNSNEVTWKNVTQSNDITDTAYWGAMTSNFCKNLKYDGCKLSRFDAHEGMYNTTILNSELGHQYINAIGSGLLHVENCKIYGNSAINLRGDYGSTWEGDLILKDITMVNTGNVTLISGVYTNHYFGYKCHLPHNIIIDGLKLEIKTTVFVLPSFADPSYRIDLDTLDGTPNGIVNNNPTYITDTVTVKNTNLTVRISTNTSLFANTVFVHEK